MERYYRIIHNFITKQQELLLIDRATAKLNRLFPEYLNSHTDSVIRGYREAMVSGWSLDKNEDMQVAEILGAMATKVNSWVLQERAREGLSSPKIKWSPPHILDLRDGDSGILPHVDYVEATGSVISGLCLGSPAVMVFRHVRSADTFKVLLPPRCLYMQRDDLRYNYTHEIPMTNDLEHSINGEFVHRKRRIAIMLRDKLVLRQYSSV